MIGWRDIRPAALVIGPNIMALLTFAAGVMLLASGATPGDPERLRWLADHAPLPVIEVSHFVSSIIGLMLVLVAFGLRQRLDAAWSAAVTLLATAATLALFKGMNWGETVVLTTLCLMLLPLHAAFPRMARLSRLEIKPGWLLSAFAAFVGAGMLSLWSYHNVAYGDQLFWRVMVSADASRSLRAWTGVGVLFLAIGLWRLVSTPATPAIVSDHDPDFARARAILAEAQKSTPDSNLALLGDKRFLFSESGKSFLMFGVRGRSWIAFGAPVGLVCERQELLWRFRELADAHAARLALYAVGPDLLPEIVEMGFAVQKTGESATVRLEDFSLQGRKREVLRRNWRKAAESGAQFEVIDAGRAALYGKALQSISDQWLAHHAGGEKGFSMGRFDLDYINEFPCALVRVEGQIVAFANLWTTADRASFSMDLMRYGENAPKNIMDFLFVELLAWGREQGYESFEFGMAPLAGLEARRLAPLMTRVGRLLFERGEDLYNFQGVRRYKDKYDPIWSPRYIAAANKWSIGVALADVSLLSAGGVSALTRRPKTQPAPASPKPAASRLATHRA
ncbi:MAG TPA: phosphatidylglycerol lysyltransferase domain-containing protein [Caulobacteraceae bacterium]|nr:phosphatidylglycerol lysyltransferase domain-containing protein [Caulobacteraceae bacterium]